ncbi:multiple antibiotic resistance protein [Methylomarinovum caldicuralii]|uniref:UPF0056 membrane protein n=1 Tax=Methylomarinovum caldicuralii TaxID=438856 RepID=A0AAU9C8I0_9GAMM|nr:NAAT family transporter [Methylomarinovum caldicuralii]BCX81756.1 multiple antibiotic resistance protein [Methylomarinovum caldicuralii]
MPEYGFYLQAFIGFLAIVNPMGAVPVFLALTSDRSHEERRAIASTAALTVLLVLLAALWGGDVVLRFFGIGIPAFRVGGGLLIILMAIAMLHARQSHAAHTEDEAAEASEREAIGVVPLGIPLMAGPGTISLVIVIAHQVASIMDRLWLSLCVAAVAAIVWIALHLAEPIGSALGVTGLNIMVRIMGLLLAAIGVQILAEGGVALVLGLLPE